jgi:hypothetical protein
MPAGCREHREEESQRFFSLFEPGERFPPPLEVLRPGEPACGHGLASFPGWSAEALLAEQVITAAEVAHRQPGSPEQICEPEPGGT